jgi:NTE family protein
VKLSSACYDRSDLAADYHNRYVFKGKTFGDLLASREPMVVINATDMVHGTRVSFVQDVFDAYCSDLSTFPMARACAASSAVPLETISKSEKLRNVMKPQ